MSCSVLVVGAPPPPGCAASQTWRAAADALRTRLVARLGPAVDLEYAEFLTDDVADRPAVDAALSSGDAALPLVFIDGLLRFAGGKLRFSAIERAVAEALVPSDRPSEGGPNRA